MLAYSSIAHAGYLLAAFAGLGTIGIAAASFYAAAYAAMNVGIFAVITLVSGYDDQLPMIDDFRGLIYRAPLLGSLLLFFLVSLVGIPFTGGFFGKFYSFSAAVDGGAIALAIIGLLNSGLAAAYYLRLALATAQRQPSATDQPAPPRRKSVSPSEPHCCLPLLPRSFLASCPERFCARRRPERTRCRFLLPIAHPRPLPLYLNRFRN